MSIPEDDFDDESRVTTNKTVVVVTRTYSIIHRLQRSHHWYHLRRWLNLTGIKVVVPRLCFCCFCFILSLFFLPYYFESFYRHLSSRTSILRRRIIGAVIIVLSVMFKIPTATPPCVIIPPGLDHTVCLEDRNYYEAIEGGICQSGQPGALCVKTSDCVKPPGLEHPVCGGGKCQSGQPGSLCGVTDDCVVQTDLVPPHAVCLDRQCQSGKSSALCGQTDDCVVPPGLGHAVCRDNVCQRWVQCTIFIIIIHTMW